MERDSFRRAAKREDLRGGGQWSSGRLGQRQGPPKTQRGATRDWWKSNFLW